METAVLDKIANTIDYQIKSHNINLNDESVLSTIRTIFGNIILKDRDLFLLNLWLLQKNIELSGRVANLESMESKLQEPTNERHTRQTRKGNARKVSTGSIANN
jgi:hypothetical protein